MGTARLMTERLTLRKYKETDAAPLFLHFGCNKKIYVFSGWNPYATEEMAKETVYRFISSYHCDRFYGWTIEYNNELIGTIGAYDYDDSLNSIEVGISIKEECWGNGFATEALIGVLDYLTGNEKIKHVTAWCALENTGSIKAMKKAGMVETCIAKDAIIIDGNRYDKLLFHFTS